MVALKARSAAKDISSLSEMRENIVTAAVQWWCGIEGKSSSGTDAQPDHKSGGERKSCQLSVSDLMER